MNIPTTTSGHVTRKQVRDALADLNPPDMPLMPLPCCPGCAWAALRESGVTDETFAFYHDQVDEYCFGEPEYHCYDENGKEIEWTEETEELVVLVDEVVHDDDPLLEPLDLDWDGDPTSIEAVFRKHGLPYVTPKSADDFFQIVPHAQT